MPHFPCCAGARLVKRSKLLPLKRAGLGFQKGSSTLLSLCLCLLSLFPSLPPSLSLSLSLSLSVSLVLWVGGSVYVNVHSRCVHICSAQAGILHPVVCFSIESPSQAGMHGQHVQVCMGVCDRLLSLPVSLPNRVAGDVSTGEPPKGRSARDRRGRQAPCSYQARVNGPLFCRSLKESSCLAVKV